MPGDPLKKVRSGDRLQIPAATYNAFIDAAIAHRNGRATGGELQPLLRQSGVVPVKNLTGIPQPRFSVVGLGDPIIPPDANVQEFKRQVTFTGNIPNKTVHHTRFAIYLEPVDNQRVGLAVVAGVAITQLLVLGVPYACAELITGSSQVLLNVPHGPAQVLWMDATAGPLRWAIVRLEESDYEAVVQVTSNMPTGGFYPGQVQRWENGNWSTLYPCKVVDMNA
jgi:hypothetical protein